jgi:hypothetical protein
MNPELGVFVAVIWPYAAGFVLWIVACATWETTR